MNIKPEILYIAHRLPYPPNKGDKIRSFNEIKHLSNQFLIDLVCLADDPDDLKQYAPLRSFCRRVIVFRLRPVIGKLKGLVSLITGQSISEGYFYHMGMARLIKRELGRQNYQAVICFSSPMARYLESVFAAMKVKPGVIMDFCDLDSDKWRQYGASMVFPLNLIYRLEARRLLKFEKRINQWVDASVFVSDNEISLFKRVFPGARNLVAIPNGVDGDYFRPRNCRVREYREKDRQGPTLMFAGVMDYHANVDGVVWFCDRVLPLVREQIPGTRLLIVGRNPSHPIQWLGRQKYIVVTGSVPDMRPWYIRADICVVPLRIARGVQNKVLEAMAMAKPVVSTGAALQGLSVVPDQHLMKADDAESFARAVITLLRDPIRAAHLGRQGREFVSSTYGWPSYMERFSALISRF